MLGRTDRRLRMVALLVVFSLFGTTAMLRLSYWQVIAAPDLVVKATGMMRAAPATTLARADIVDRNGRTLAQSTTYHRLDAYPVDIPAERRAEIVETLAGILDLSPAEQQAYLAKLSSGKEYEWLERRLSPEESAAIMVSQDTDLLPGIDLGVVQTRAYPIRGGQGDTSLASQLLGFVAGTSGGAAGVEQEYEARLSGAEQAPVDTASIAGAGDVGLAALADLDDLVAPPLRLTIDARLQQQLEIELTTARGSNRARSASAIVMRADTGEILASASVPSYDANQYGAVFQENPAQVRDRNVQDVYEPGSVMKAFTVAAALDAGVVTPQTKIFDEPVFKVKGGEVKNSGESIGLKPVKDIIAWSRNVGTSKMAFKMARGGNIQRAARLLFEMWDRVGMVGPTGVDLPAESPGIWYDPAEYDWAEMDLANKSFGQGVALTLMHLITGYAPLVNGGYRVQPHVVDDGDDAAVSRERVLSPKLAGQVRDILTHVTGAVPTYANGALIPGYLIGGKTGTAQIWDPKLWNPETREKGAFIEDRFNHTFVGFVGSNRPEVLIAVRIERARPVETKPNLDLAIESYELFHMIADDVIDILDIKRSRDPYAGLPIPGTDAAKSSKWADELRAVRQRVGWPPSERATADGEAAAAGAGGQKHPGGQKPSGREAADREAGDRASTTQKVKDSDAPGSKRRADRRSADTDA